MTTSPTTQANPQTLTVTSTAVAVVAPAACRSVTVHQQQGSDPPSHKFQPFLADGVTALGGVQQGGAGFKFSAPSGTAYAPGTTVGYIGLLSADTGTALFSVFADPLVAKVPEYVPDTGTGGSSGLIPAPQPGDAALGKIFGAAGNVIGIIRAVVVLTSAQLKALQTTGILIVPAAPAGYGNVLGGVIFNYKYGATAYTLGNADNVIQLEYVGQTTSLLKAACAGLVDQTSNKFIPGSSGLTTVLASSVALAVGIEAKLTGTAAALTLGDGTVTVVAEYKVVPLV